MVYSFDVTMSTHDLLKAGHTEPYRTRVVVDADTDHAAHLLAAQYAHEMNGYLIVTGVYWRL